MKLEQPQAIRTIFFDAGFTLLQPSISHATICHEVCRRFKCEIDYALLEQAIYIQDQQRFLPTNEPSPWHSDHYILNFWISYYHRVLQSLIIDPDLRQEIAHSIYAECNKHTSWKLYDDVLPTLHALHSKGYRLGIISDWGSALNTIVQKLELTQYFDNVLISATLQYAKPSPHFYEQALKRANDIADYSLHVGDSYLNDVLGARSIGMHAVLLDRSGKLEQTSLDCFLIHSLTELLDLLEVDVNGHTYKSSPSPYR